MNAHLLEEIVIYQYYSVVYYQHDRLTIN